MKSAGGFCTESPPVCFIRGLFIVIMAITISVYAGNAVLTQHCDMMSSGYATYPSSSSAYTNSYPASRSSGSGTRSA